MGKVFAVVRPESLKLRGRIYSFVESLGYRRDQRLILPKGAFDEHAAQWANGLSVPLIVLPYHLHRDGRGNPVDGIGVALLLSERYEKNVPIVMPVSGFSRGASLDNRLEELHEQRPRIWKNVVVVRENEEGSHRLAHRILRVAGVRRSQTPAARSSRTPRIRQGLGSTGLPGQRAESGQYSIAPPLPENRTPTFRAFDRHQPPKVSGEFPVQRAQERGAEGQTKVSGEFPARSAQERGAEGHDEKEAGKNTIGGRTVPRKKSGG